jgi:hypothetical protein
MENAAANKAFLSGSKSGRARLSVPVVHHHQEPIAFQSLLAESIDGDDDLIELEPPKQPPQVRLSLGTIAHQREQLAALRKVMELDEEIDYLHSTMESMRETFKVMFAEATANRIACDFELNYHRKPMAIDYMGIVEGLDLDSRPYDEWAILIESAITAAVH